MSSSMKFFLKAIMVGAGMIALMFGIMVVIVMFTRSWGSEMKALFEMYIFPAIVFLMCGISGVVFLRTLTEEKRKH